MKSARNQLILLGFICQAFTWDDILMPLAVVGLWVICLTGLQGKVRFNPTIECLLLILGSFAGLFVGRALGYNSHFFIGHGLTLMQAARLLRPLNRRERIFSILIASFQLGVACTSLFDLRFVPVFLAMALLLPKSFMELETEDFTAENRSPKAAITARVLVTIIVVAAAIFLVFPRGTIGAAQLLRSGPAERTSLLDNVMDPTRSASAQSRRVLFQIQGEQLGYLRCFPLTDFDGVRWTDSRESSARMQRVPERSHLLTRRVRVKDVGVLGGVLPTDGRAYSVRGNFFRQPAWTVHGTTRYEAAWNTGNNSYSFTIVSDSKPEDLPQSFAARMTNAPAASAKIRGLLTAVCGEQTNALSIARGLESYLKTNFTYRLGGPKLNRLNALEDFLFEQKEGHCERFASALTLLLRMQGIPSRVVIGYLPHGDAAMSGWHNVRAADAHAWTEAYIDGQGWITLDATPAAALPAFGNILTDWWDTLDLAWNLHVVNFDRSSQNFLVTLSAQTAGRLARMAARNSIWIGGCSVLLLFVAGVARFRSKSAKLAAASPPEQARIVVGEYYGKMLRLYASHGYHRLIAQTPNEFLTSLPAEGQAVFADAQFVTNVFCATRYGAQVLTPEMRMHIEAALARIQQGLSNQSR